MSWVRLNEIAGGRSDGIEIHVNLDQVSSLQWDKNTKLTTVWFLAGEDKGKITVSETPEDILSKAGIKT